MTYEEIKDYIGKQVVITIKSGKKFRGLITNTVSQFDSSSGKEEIEIDVGSCFYGLTFDEIESIIDIL